MFKETTILVENISLGATDSSTFAFSDKKPGAGFHNEPTVDHTAVYSVNAFVGTIKLQAALEIYPGDADWFDIQGTEIGGDSTMLGNVPYDDLGSGSIQNITVDFTGNFVWIRAAYNLQNGSIIEIRYNH